jgi:hypothetical protein
VSEIQGLKRFHVGTVVETTVFFGGPTDSGHQLQVFQPQPKCTSQVPKWSWGDVHHPCNLRLCSMFLLSEKSELEIQGMQTEMVQIMKSRPPLACLLLEDFRKQFKCKQFTSWSKI